MTSQLRKAAISIPSNLAEGSGRNTQRELAHFSRISLGSANEVEYQILLARDLVYLDPVMYRELSERVDEVKRMLASFIASLVVPTDN